MNIFKRIFGKKKTEAISIPSGKKKVVLIVGHGANGDKGAQCHNGTWEYDYNLKVAKILNEKLGCPFVLREGLGISGAALKALTCSHDLIIELHLNAFNGKAKGCEVLVYEGDTLSYSYGKSFAKAFCTKFNRVMRGEEGLKIVSTSDRGGKSLYVLRPAKAAILVEPMFCDNKDELLPVDMYAEFLMEWIGKL